MKKDVHLKCIRSGQKKAKNAEGQLYFLHTYTNTSPLFFWFRKDVMKAFPRKRNLYRLYRTAVLCPWCWKASLADKGFSPCLERCKVSSSWSRKEGAFILGLTCPMCFLFLYLQTVAVFFKTIFQVLPHYQEYRPHPTPSAAFRWYAPFLYFIFSLWSTHIPTVNLGK